MMLSFIFKFSLVLSLQIVVNIKKQKKKKTNNSNKLKNTNQINKQDNKMAQNKTMTDYFMHDLSIIQQNIIHTHTHTQKPTNKMNTRKYSHTKKQKNKRALYAERE